jgi:small GTP-binding protein
MSEPITKKFDYDVFLSHSSKDKPVVRALAERLKNDGLRVWLDEWIIKPGDMIGLSIEKGLEQSRTLVLFMSANAFPSEWVTLERHTALFRDPTNQDRRFIPLRLDDAPIGDTLRQFAYVDWRQPSDEAYARLLAACRPLIVSESPRRRTEELRSSWVLKGHTSLVHSVAVTPDGRRAVSGSADRTVRVWDLEREECAATLKGHTRPVTGVSVTADGRRAVSGSYNDTVRVWDLERGECVATLEGHAESVRGVSVTPDWRRAVSGSADKTVRVWDLERRECAATLEGHTAAVLGVSVTADGRRAVSGSSDRTVRVWDLERGECVTILEGHTNTVWGVSVTADGRRAVSGSDDNTVRVWDLERGVCVATLEGHTGAVYGVSVTADGRRAVSGSEDKTVRVWDLERGECVATLEGHTGAVSGVSVTPDGRRAVSGSHDDTVRVWDLPPLVERPDRAPLATRYTNAKVVLVGDSGVGKSGLFQRLTADTFEASISTDGAWASHLPLPRDATAGEIERETWLWDFAGQADYRLIHQLFLDETALAVLVFNPQSDNPFEGLGQWDRALERAKRRDVRKLLVAARCDRGGLMVSRKSVESFAAERKFAGYLETSALTGAGCAELRAAIDQAIKWKAIPWTSSPRVFKLLKEAIIALKGEGVVLLRLIELKQRLEMRMPGEAFTIDELRAVVGLLAGPGIVWMLEFGDYVLLEPERINSYAAVVVRSVRSHVEEIGCIDEERVLNGDLDYQDMKRLPRDQEQEVLRKMHQTFIARGLCLRERAERATLLVFPSYYRRERPDLGEHPAALVTYHFKGAVDETYATLVVRLCHTPVFTKDTLWRFAADFKTEEGKRVGLTMTKKPEGAAEMSVYFAPGIPDDTKVTFIRYVHDHLKSKDRDMVRVRHYVCPKCGEPVESRRAVELAVQKRRKTIPCQYCGKAIPLNDLIEKKFASDAVEQRVRHLDAEAGASISDERVQLILINHALATAHEAGQIFRLTPKPDLGIDGEIEFKDYAGKPSGKRAYLSLRASHYTLTIERTTGSHLTLHLDVRHIDSWRRIADPVMLAIRTPDGVICWMNVSKHLREKSVRRKTRVTEVPFEGEPFTALNLQRLRDTLIPPPA